MPGSESEWARARGALRPAECGAVWQAEQRRRDEPAPRRDERARAPRRILRPSHPSARRRPRWRRAIRTPLERRDETGDPLAVAVPGDDARAVAQHEDEL